MTREEGLQRKLVEYVEYVHALEQNILLQLDSLILNTGDQELVGIFRRHKEETRRQQQRLRERLRALGGPRPVSVGKDLAAIACSSARFSRATAAVSSSPARVARRSRIS